MDSKTIQTISKKEKGREELQTVKKSWAKEGHKKRERKEKQVINSSNHLATVCLYVIF